MKDILKKFKEIKGTGRSLLDSEVSTGALSDLYPNKLKPDNAGEKKASSVKKIIYTEDEVPPAVKRRKDIQAKVSTSKLMRISHYKNNIYAILSDRILKISRYKIDKAKIKGSFPFLEEWPEKVANLEECQDFVVNVRDWLANLSSETKESIIEFFDMANNLTKKDSESENFKDHARSFSMKLADSYQEYCDKKQVVSFI